MSFTLPWIGALVTNKNLFTYLEGFITGHQLDASKLTLTTSAALVHHQVLPSAADIDLVVDPTYFNEVCSIFPSHVYRKEFVFHSETGEKIELKEKKIIVPFKGTRFELWSEYVDGQVSLNAGLPVKVSSIASVLYLKARIGRPKDIAHIAKILGKLR